MIFTEECTDKVADTILTTATEPEPQLTASRYLFKEELDSQDFEYLCLTESKQSQQSDSNHKQANPELSGFPDVSEFSPQKKDDSSFNIINNNVIMDLENKINKIKFENLLDKDSDL